MGIVLWYNVGKAELRGVAVDADNLTSNPFPSGKGNRNVWDMVLREIGSGGGID